MLSSSLCDVEIPTAEDVVPATAVVNEDGTITMNYTVEYSNYAYLYATQVLGKAGDGVQDTFVEDTNAPVEYYNIQGMRVNPTESGLYIMRQGNKVTKIVR